MTTTNDQMNPVAAHNLITQQVWLPVFFEKLAAEYGVQPQSEADVTHLLELGSQLRDHQAAATAQGNPLFKQALAAIGGDVQQNHAVNVAAEAELLKEASAYTAQNEHLARAVLALSLQQPGA
jgi:hypothetical protein